MLHLLRDAFPDVEELLALTGSTMGWRQGSGWALDVAEFDAHMAADRPEAAIGLYRGDLVPSCADEWLQPVRAGYRATFVTALRRLAATQETLGDVDAAVTTAERVLQVDPTDEVTGRLLMRLCDARGERGRALRVYHGLVAALRDALDVDPDPETTHARDALLSGPQVTGQRAEPLVRPPLVGRVPERRRLVEAWRAAESGWSAAVVVAGEAGLGKSRLVEDFARWCAHDGVPVATASGYAAERVLAYGPVTEWLRSVGGRRRARRLPTGQLVELSRLLPELTRLAALPAPEPLAEADRRRRLWSAVTDALVGARDPLLLVLDDAHWADQESLRLLHHLVRTAHDAPLLVVMTVRVDLVDDTDAIADVLRGLRALDRLTEITLPPLSVDETFALARHAGPGTTKGAGHRLWRLTGGNPLFVVEALRSGWRPDAADGIPAAVTPRVQQVIEDRLQRLSPGARELLQVAAVVGRDFGVDLVSDVADTDDATAARGLDELWRHRVIRERGDSAYDFAHDQIRLVAYERTSSAARRRLHRRVARSLAAGEGASAARVAYHLDGVGDADGAVTWYARAAAEAQQLSAPHEAVGFVERARELLRVLPASGERHRRELALLTALPAPLASTEGYASERISAVHDRALRVAALAGAEPEPPLLWSMAFAGLVREDFVVARRSAQQLHDRGVREADDVLVAEGACLLGIASFWQAELHDSREWFDRTLAHVRPEHATRHLATYGQDPQVVALARLANIHALLGDPDRAHATCAQALRLADGLGHPLTRAAAYVFAALLALDTGDEALVRRCAETLPGVDTDALPIRYTSRALGGYLRVLDGDVATGLQEIRAALDEAGRAPAAPGMTALLRRIQLAAACAARDEPLAVETAGRLDGGEGPSRVWRGVAAAVLQRQ